MGGTASRAVLPQLTRAHDSEKKAACHLLAWGNNAMGQCGVQQPSTLLQPKLVEGLPEGLPMRGVYAGSHHSALVTGHGSMFCWGRNASGELGVGLVSDDPLRTPALVLGLDGREVVTSAAFGRRHSLMLDAEGHVWAAGCNSHGQLGMGTPIVDEKSVEPEPVQSLPKVVVNREVRQRLSRLGFPPVATGEAVAQFLTGFPPHVRKVREVTLANGFHDDTNWARTNRVAAAAVGIHEDDQVTFLLAERWQFQNPMRVGLHLHEILQGAGGSWSDNMLRKRSQSMSEASAASLLESSTPLQVFNKVAQMSSASGGAALADDADADDAWAMPLPDAPLPNLGAHRVVQLAAAKVLSMALTSSGEVWLFGMGTSNQLGNGNMLQSNPRPLGGWAARTIAEHGGAVSIGAGNDFCAALTLTGRVVVWGMSGRRGLVLGPPAAGEADGAQHEELPPLTNMAVGAKTILMTDGVRVWHLQEKMLMRGSEASTLLSFEGPISGIKQITIGMDACAVIDSDNHLWTCGQITDSTSRIPGASNQPHTAKGEAAMPGLTSNQLKFTKLESLGAVAHVALGSQHALALLRQ